MLVNRLGQINELMTANNYTSRVSPVFKVSNYRVHHKIDSIF